MSISKNEIVDKPKNILHIVDGLGVGGAETLVVTLLKNLQGYNLHLIVLGKPYTLAAQLPADCKTVLYDFKSYKDIPGCALKIRSYIKKNKIDIVHSHMYWSNITSRLATPVYIPLFNCIQNISSLASYTANRASLYLEKFTYRKRHHIIAVSETVLADFDHWVGLKGKSTVLYNIIDDVFFTAKPKLQFSKDKIRLVAVGNLRKQKNYTYLLRAFRNMPSHISIDIYGTGTLKDEMQDEIDRYKLTINLCGLQSDMHLLLREYDGYVMCSTHEGLSLALMEAMASGLPAFLSDIPVQRESAGNAALYFDLTQPESLVQKILSAFSQQHILITMSEESINRANTIARKDRYLARLIALYENA